MRLRRSLDDVDGGEVEVGRPIERLRLVLRVARCEVEELDLGRGEEGEPFLAGQAEIALEHLARVAAEGRAVEVLDVAEHDAAGLVVGRPGEELEARRVGPGEDVGLLDPGEAVDGRTVELEALVEDLVELGRRDGDRLVGPEHVGEPQTDEADPPLLDRAKHVFLLAFHGTYSAPFEGLGKPHGPRSHCVHRDATSGKRSVGYRARIVWTRTR